MKIRIIIPVLLISLLIMLYSCMDEKSTKEIEKNTAERSIYQNEAKENIYNISATQFTEQKMEIGIASKNRMNDVIRAAGYVEVPHESKAEVRSYIGGYLKTSKLLPGDYVKKGQLLISLENLEYIQLQQDYLQAKEELAYLKSVYERQKILADEKITSQNSKQRAESEYNSALANYEGLRKKLQLINIDPDKISAESISSSINLYSPIDGYINSVNAATGKFADPSDVIFEIINTNHLHIELKVYEQDILKIRKGQELTFRIPEANDEIYKGEVFLVGKTIDQTDRTVTVHCHISADSEIPEVLGMYVEAEITFESHDGMCLPPGAFVSEEGEYAVYLFNSLNEDIYVFEKIKVEVGQQNENCYEIIGDSQNLLKGKQLLLQGAFDL